MLRQTFVYKQQRLRDEVLVLGSQVAETLRGAIDSLQQADLGRAMQLIAHDRHLNRKCAAIEADTLALLVTQQPMAGDLRALAAILEVALELEQIGDHIKEISALNLKLGQLNSFKPILSDIGRMAGAAHKMLDRALEAFARQQPGLAQAIPPADDEVDEFYTHIYNQLVAAIKSEPEVVNRAVYLSQIAHHLERVADRTLNICEWVIFSATGEMRELNGLDLDNSQLAYVRS